MADRYHQRLGRQELEHEGLAALALVHQARIRRLLTLSAGLGIRRAVTVDFHSVRNLAVWKGLTAERAYWRGRVFLVCRNGAMLRKPNRSTAFTYRHAWRFLRTLPDVD